MTCTQFMPASRKDMVARMYVMFFTGSMAPDWYNTAWNSRTHYMWDRLTWYNSSITKSTVGKWMTISHGVWYTDLIVGCESNQSALSHSKFNTSKLQLPVISQWVACIYQVLPSYLIQLDPQRVSGTMLHLSGCLMFFNDQRVSDIAHWWHLCHISCHD